MRSHRDSPMPISHFEMLRLIRHRFGDSWPEKLKVKGMLGTGSVNIAIEYEDNGQMKEGGGGRVHVDSDPGA